MEVGAGLALSGRGFLLVGGAVCSRQLPPEQAVVGDSPQRVLHLGLGPQVCGHRVPGGGGVAGGGGALFLLPVVSLLILRGEGGGGGGAVTLAWGEEMDKVSEV